MLQMYCPFSFLGRNGDWFLAKIEAKNVYVMNGMKEKFCTCKTRMMIRNANNNLSLRYGKICVWPIAVEMLNIVT